MQKAPHLKKTGAREQGLLEISKQATELVEKNSRQTRGANQKKIMKD